MNDEPQTTEIAPQPDGHAATGSRDLVEPDGEARANAQAAEAPAPSGDRASLKEQVLAALRHVNDPELGINIVDLGLVYGVEIEADTVHVTYTLTTMGCPIGPLIEAEIKQFLSGVEGVENVDAEMVLRPPWTPEMMSEEAKAALGFF
jgi:metal-sulfur cluster biosynthetic enzyme